MEKRIVITIGRQFGSGGRDIGRKLAELCGVNCYDKELLAEAARESGLSSEFFDRADERAPSSLANALSMGFGYGGILSNESIFRFQSEAITKLAARESCVIVGRCADYVLRDHPGLCSVFVHAPLDFRIARVLGYGAESEQAARQQIEKTDKSRAGYYDFYTDKRWGVAASYHLSVDASVLGIDRTAAFIRSFAEEKLR